MAGRGINGGAVTLAAAGAYLVYAGIRNVPVLDGLRDLFAGRLPTPRPRTPTAVTFATTVGAQASTAAGATSGGGGQTLAQAVAAAVKAGYKYNLGAVKDYVANAAYEIGPKFAIKTIYGWAPGLYEHPKGRALDFMINTPGLGASTGQALATYVVANYQRLNVYYVIWNRQVWNATKISQGWHKYTGTNPHTDHVHVSFN